ncbi:50S ribosomal protein L15 [Neoehrlichia mikurensis]|uniref:Large ribosomal subunit protein uL15 n=2 Tax=Neoehrlichia mikurensis TaxID=89586 RepID=A0A9Q9F3X4_9RICK|nr:50S ribosomal protein L15 [Neoehrlichia mikurensis]QXK91808.1 50S ribosomal protein L15 [Neoehrlichia mikurensis]UTO55547.1 50S ribosomal protein L15 [Neoehrlichia mikurensis]UTO56468.1 50S ribosomal protein L15 [Neoehrlichia mikurensis]
MVLIMKLNNMFTGLSRKKKAKVLGRGIGCGKGKTSGKGHKGQKARSGSSINGFEGGQQSIFTRLPKRGFRSLSKLKYKVINLFIIQELIDKGKINNISNITKELLYDLKVISSINDKVKVLGKGQLNSQVRMDYDYISKSAAKYILPINM